LLPPKSVAHIHLDRIPVEPEVTLAFIGGLAGGHCLANIYGAAVPWPSFIVRRATLARSGQNGCN
jgi:hypothetical protein